MLLGVTGETRSLLRGPDQRAFVRKQVRRALAEGRRLNAETQFVDIGGAVYPVYLREVRQGQGQGQGLSGMGDLGFSWGSVTGAFGKAFKDIGKVLRQIPHAPVKLARQTATQIKEHQKEIVGIGAAVIGTGLMVTGLLAPAGVFLAPGVATPLGLSIAGSGIGATMGKSGGWGKPLQWGGGALIGGAAGLTAGALLPTAVGGWGGAQAIGSGVSSLFAPSSAGAAVAPASGVGMEIAPGPASMAIAPAAQAGASSGGIFGTVGDILKNAALLAPTILGSGGGVSVATGAPGATGVSPYSYPQSSPALEYVGSGGATYGGGGGSWGGGGAAGGEAAVPGEKITAGPVSVDVKKANEAMPFIALGLGAAAAVALGVWMARRKA